MIEPVKVCRLDLELQSGCATLAPRERNEDTGGEPALLRRLQLAADEIQCFLPVDGFVRYLDKKRTAIAAVTCARASGRGMDSAT